MPTVDYYSLDRSLPASSPQRDDVVFVCLDFEFNDNAAKQNHGEICKIGITWLDTREIAIIAPHFDL